MHKCFSLFVISIVTILQTVFDVVSFVLVLFLFNHNSRLSFENIRIVLHSCHRDLDLDKIAL